MAVIIVSSILICTKGQQLSFRGPVWVTWVTFVVTWINGSEYRKVFISKILIKFISIKHRDFSLYMQFCSLNTIKYKLMFYRVHIVSIFCVYLIQFITQPYTKAQLLYKLFYLVRISDKTGRPTLSQGSWAFLLSCVSLKAICMPIWADIYL